MSFQDAFDDPVAKHESSIPTPPILPSKSTNLVSTTEDVAAKASVPKKTGVEQIADLQKGDLQDIIVFDEGNFHDYAQYCANFLEVRLQH